MERRRSRHVREFAVCLALMRAFPCRLGIHVDVIDMKSDPFVCGNGHFLPTTFHGDRLGRLAIDLANHRFKAQDLVQSLVARGGIIR